MVYSRFDPVCRGPYPLSTWQDLMRVPSRPVLAMPVCLCRLASVPDSAALDLRSCSPQMFRSSPNAQRPFLVLAHESGFSGVAAAAHWLPEYVEWNSQPATRYQ